MSTDHDSYDQQYIATHAAPHAPPPVTLDDETAQFGVLPHDKTDLWEETAFALVAECGDHVRSVSSAFTIRPLSRDRHSLCALVASEGP